MLKISEIGKKLRLTEDELLPFGHYMGKIDYQSVLERHKNTKNGKYITVTSITPTPLGEGKSTTTIGLCKGSANGAKKSRQPSDSPPAVRLWAQKVPPQAAGFPNAFL